MKSNSFKVFCLTALTIAFVFTNTEYHSLSDRMAFAAAELQQYSDESETPMMYIIEYSVMDLPEIVSHADVIVLGRVTRRYPSFYEPATRVVRAGKVAEDFQRANPGVSYMEVRKGISDAELRGMQKDMNRSRSIRTNVRVAVSKTYKGTNDYDSVIVSETGGKIGNKVEFIDKIKPLKAGDIVVLCLSRNPTKNQENTFIVTGLDEGKYYVYNGNAFNRDPLRAARLSDLEQEITKLIVESWYRLPDVLFYGLGYSSKNYPMSARQSPPQQP